MQEHFFFEREREREREREIVAIVSKFGGGVDNSVLWLSFAQQKVRLKPEPGPALNLLLTIVGLALLSFSHCLMRSDKELSSPRDISMQYLTTTWQIFVQGTGLRMPTENMWKQS
jgi:hypothetical protein